MTRPGGGVRPGEERRLLTNPNRGPARVEVIEGRTPQPACPASSLLEEAGCTDAALLGHPRGPGPHWLGCHALDAVLGES
jgi:hypothetical protein